MDDVSLMDFKQVELLRRVDKLIKVIFVMKIDAKYDFINLSLVISPSLGQCASLS